MPPPKRHRRRAPVHLEHLPRKRRHHALERLVARVEAAAERAVELVGLDDGVVRPDLQHVLAGLRRAAVDAELVGRGVDGAPVGQVELVGCFDLPVFDELFDEVWEALGGVVCFFGWGGGTRVSNRGVLGVLGTYSRRRLCVSWSSPGRGRGATWPRRP